RSRIAWPKPSRPQALPRFCRVSWLWARLLRRRHAAFQPLSRPWPRRRSSPMSQSLENKAETAPEMRQSGLIEIFLSFGMIGFLGFGGVGPWVRWLLVERKGWYSEAEFVNTFALANFIPGGNVVALATIAGAKLRGWPGSLMAITGLCLPPAILVCAAGSL